MPRFGRVLSAMITPFDDNGALDLDEAQRLARHLQAEGVRCDLLALTLGHKQARRLGLDPRGYRDILHLVDRDAILARGQQLLAGNSHPDVDDFESQCYLGINYQEWVDAHGDGEWAIALRCAQFDLEAGDPAGIPFTAHAGAGIVAGSNPEAELLETRVKFRPIVDALA